MFVSGQLDKQTTNLNKLLDGESVSIGSEVAMPKNEGPQIRLDEQGNIILDESSLLVNQLKGNIDGPRGNGGDLAIPTGGRAPKKQTIAKWSDDENNKFFHALQLYGEDLFMIQTHIPLRTPAQIKKKLKLEQKKNTARYQDALNGVGKIALTTDQFQKDKGVRVNKAQWTPADPSKLPPPEAIKQFKIRGKAAWASGRGLHENAPSVSAASALPPMEIAKEPEISQDEALLSLFGDGGASSSKDAAAAAAAPVIQPAPEIVSTEEIADEDLDDEVLGLL